MKNIAIIKHPVLDYLTQIWELLTEIYASILVYLVKLGVGAEPEKEMNSTEVVSIKDDIIYSISFAADANAYNRYEPIFRKMTDSIKLS